MIDVGPHRLLVFFVARLFIEQISGELGLHDTALTSSSNDLIEENYVVVDFPDGWSLDSCGFEAVRDVFHALISLLVE